MWKGGGWSVARGTGVGLEARAAASEKQVKDDEEKDKAESAAAIVANAGAHVVAAAAEEQKENNENDDQLHGRQSSMAVRRLGTYFREWAWARVDLICGEKLKPDASCSGCGA